MTPSHPLRTVAVLLAGGVGSRMGHDVPKQLVEVGGRTVLEHALDSLHGCDAVDEIVLVLPEGWTERAGAILGTYPKLSRILEGGATRHESARVALASIDDEDGKILLHDAARPLLDERIINDCIAALDHHDAVAVVVPPTDTIVEVDADGFVATTLERSRLRRNQTPQAFRLPLLRDAYRRAAQDPELATTDDCGVVLRYRPDVAVATVEGDERNLKVTHPVDLQIVDTLLRFRGEQDRGSGDHPARPSYGVVVLTQGTRPAELARGLDSLLAQRDVDLDVVVVGNGFAPTDLPTGVRGVALAENVGIPAGRNAGVPHVQGGLLFFLDDDAWLPDAGLLAELGRRFAADPALGLVQPRVVDPSGASNPTRWIPRIRKGDPVRSSVAFSVWEGAVALPRAVFEQAGGWPEEFFYAHEGIELAWRVWDTGHRAEYAGDLVVHHPAIDPRRHSDYYRLNARNRVWLARRNLPAPLEPLYVGTWTAVQVVRSRRDGDALRSWFGGFREGWREDPGPRRPMSWRTVAAMTRRGRPPVV